MTLTHIAPNKVYTNTKGRFRLVTEIRNIGSRSDIHYTAAYRNTKGVVKAVVGNCDRSGIESFATWATREATPEERAEVLAVLGVKESE